jgi:DNA-directed RNA polymerase subunit RPC12/RpoP
MTTCPTCRSKEIEPRKVYDYQHRTASRPNVYLAWVKFYVCMKCGDQALSIPNLAGLNAEVSKLPEDNPTKKTFAIDYFNTWFRLSDLGLEAS